MLFARASDPIQGSQYTFNVVQLSTSEPCKLFLLTKKSTNLVVELCTYQTFYKICFKQARNKACFPVWTGLVAGLDISLQHRRTATHRLHSWACQKTMLGQTAHSGHDSCPCHAAYHCGHCATNHSVTHTAAMISKICSNFIAHVSC